MKLVYVSEENLGLFDGTKAAPVASQRIEQFARTLRQLEEQHAWKSEGAGAQFMNQSNPYARASKRLRGRVTGVAAHDGGILYAVDLGGETGGIYFKDPLHPDVPEGLVISAVGFLAKDLIKADGALYAALGEGDESHIMRLDPATGRYDVLTMGDTRERHPFLSPDGEVLYFDMCGYARDEEQRILARGPSAIAALNLRSGEIQEVFAHASTEYLKYTLAPDGTRRMLVRPYKPKADAQPLGCLLAPFSAIVGFVHVFSAINAARKGKKPPLSTSGFEAAKSSNAPLMVDGVPIDLKKVASENKKHDEPYPGLIPRDWRLVRILPDGTQETLQNGVMDYAPLADGGYIYSNGIHVVHVDAAGASHMLFRTPLVTDLTPMDDTGGLKA